MFKEAFISERLSVLLLLVHEIKITKTERKSKDLFIVHTFMVM